MINKVIMSDSVSDIQNTQDWKCVSTLSKKRFDQIVIGIQSIVNDKQTCDQITYLIQEVMQFDPVKRDYSQEHAKKSREKYKQKALEQGKSLYEILGMKELYLKRKKEKNNQHPQNQELESV